MARHSRSGIKQRPLRRLGLAVLLVAAVGLVAAQTSPDIRDFFNPVRTIASDQLAANARPGLWARLTGQAAKDRKIRELEAEIRDLARWQAAAISMAERMGNYEDILNLMGEPPVRGVTARIAAESDGPYAETLLANAGRAQGVEESAVAVNEGGLVGRVVQLGERSSRILLITDFNSRIPVMGEISGLRAIMYGGRDGFGMLTDLPESEDFITGERIITSGEAGVFPRGLIAGYTFTRDENWRVRFAMKEARGGFVRLLPQMQIPTPEEEPILEEVEAEDAPLPDAAPVSVLGRAEQ